MTTGKVICKTCGASGPPWNHVPTPLDRDGIGDPGHKMPTAQDTPTPEELSYKLDAAIVEIAAKANSNGLQNKTLREFLKGSDYEQARYKLADVLSALLSQTRKQVLEKLSDTIGKTPPDEECGGTMVS